MDTELKQPIEIGKKYIIKKNVPVWSIDLQKAITFCKDTVVIAHQKVANEDCYFGNLIDKGRLADYETKNEIEFSSKDVLKEYIKEEDADYKFFINFLQGLTFTF